MPIRAQYYLLWHNFRWARQYHDPTDPDADWSRGQVYAHAQALRLFCAQRGAMQFTNEEATLDSESA